MKTKAETPTEKLLRETEPKKKVSVTFKSLKAWRTQSERLIESELTDKEDKEALNKLVAKIVGKFIDVNL